MRSKGWIRQTYWLGVWGDDIDILSPNISTHQDYNTGIQQQQITLHWSPHVLDTSPVGQGWKKTYCRLQRNIRRGTLLSISIWGSHTQRKLRNTRFSGVHPRDLPLHYHPMGSQEQWGATTPGEPSLWANPCQGNGQSKAICSANLFTLSYLCKHGENMQTPQR